MAMNLRPLVAIAVGLMALGSGCASVKEHPGPAEEQRLSAGAVVVSTQQREDARQPFLLLLPAQPWAAVVLFSGGDGEIDLDAQTGAIGRGGNFLVRTRTDFVRLGLATAVIAPPTDQDTLRAFRTTDAHVLDIKGVIAYLRARLKVPVWLVGTSLGTTSVATVTSHLAGPDGPDGIVLSSTVTGTSRGAPESVYSAKLDAIRVPTLIVHHQNDACGVTPLAGARRLLDDLTQATAKELVVIEGGGPPRGPVCEPHHYHGFIGKETETVKVMADWIKAHS